MRFMYRDVGMLYIFGKYDNEWVKWDVLEYIDNTVHSYV